MSILSVVSPNLFHSVNSRQKHKTNNKCTGRLFSKKNSSSSTVCCADQTSNNFSSAATLEKDFVMFAKDQLSSKVQDGLGIVDFFRGKNLLITGSTGFLGKVLVEKILRSMPEVDKIYLLIKAKNEEAAMERLMNEMINTELFKCLREKHGMSYEGFVMSKLVPVVGDMRQTNIGIEEGVANCIAREVDIIINSAATTAFDERLDVAVDINTAGAARIISFAKKCKDLKLYVHISTAYVSRQREAKINEESFGKGYYVTSNADTYNDAPHKYIHGLDVEAEINLATTMGESFNQNEKVKKLKEMGMQRAQKYGWANTYSFTKAMGEMVVEDTKEQLPVIILRPSIIESTLKEPFPGWIEGSRMLDPVMLSYGKGKLDGFFSDPNIILDVVPADMFINSTLAVIAKHGVEGTKSNSKDDHVYQITSSVANPLMARELMYMAYQHFIENPCFDHKGNPIRISEFKYFASLEDMLSHMANSNSSVDDQKMSPRQELIRRRSMEHVMNMANIYQPYTFFNGRFDNTKVEKLIKCLSEEERKEFGFDASSIDWKDYIKSVHLHGIRKHVMKERSHEVSPAPCS